MGNLRKDNMKKAKKERVVEYINKCEELADPSLSARFEEVKNNVYCFHNTVFNINLYVNAKDAEEAMVKFDCCQMEKREEWKLFVELGKQPVGVKH